MSNGKTHLMVGAAVGVGVALIDNKKHKFSHNIFSAGAIGSVFGKMPDILEPATNPHHRQFFHSAFTFVTISTSLAKVYQWTPESSLEQILRGVMLIGGCAYLSHLVCDSSTPMGLPLVGKL